MKSNRTILVFTASVLLLPAIAYLLMSWYEARLQSLPVYGGTVKVDGKEQVFRISDFQFTDQQNRPATIAAWDNKIVVANYFFTHCPVICPKMTSQLKKVQQAFSHDPQLQLASFSVDPQRDSAAQLAWYATHFSIDTDNWQLLTGNKKQLYRFARNELKIVATDGDGGPDDFIHSESVVLIDQQKRIRGYYAGTDEKAMKQLVVDIKKLKHED